MLYLLRLIVICCVLLPVAAMSGENPGVTSALEKGREAAKTITLPSEQALAEGRKAAKEAVAKYRSPAFQARLRNEKARLQKVFGKCTASLEGEQQPPATGAILGENEKIYLFLSSSIPDATVRNYLLDISQAGDPHLVPVMRGLVKGFSDMDASGRYFARVLKEDPDCRDEPRKQKICKRFKTDILFQPPLFRKYGIERVPALVYDNGDQVYLISGDAGLDYLLERVNREVKEEALKKLIQKLRED